MPCPFEVGDRIESTDHYSRTNQGPATVTNVRETEFDWELDRPCNMGSRLGTYQTGTTYANGFDGWRLLHDEPEEEDEHDPEEDDEEDNEEDADGDSEEYEENYSIWHPDTVRAYGVWGLRITLVICGTILACLGHKEEAEACGTGLLFSFFFL